MNSSGSGTCGATFKFATAGAHCFVGAPWRLRWADILYSKALLFKFAQFAYFEEKAAARRKFFIFYSNSSN
jgi:hypothetical protein